MIGKTRLLVVTLTIAMSVPAYAEEKFEKLKAQQIRRVVADGVHWSEHCRKDGALISMDMGTKQTGIWRIRTNTIGQHTM